MIRHAVLSVVVLTLIGLPGALRAQEGKGKGEGIKLPVFKETTAETKTPGKHGDSVRITVKGSADPVVGTMVRTDADTYFVRTKPGAKPVAIATKEVTKFEASFIEGRDNPNLPPKLVVVNEPEITALVVVNGGRRTVTYSAPNLSPGELSLLQNIQSAEDDLYRLERMADRENQVMENVLAIQGEQRKSIELTNRYQELLNTMVEQRATNPFWWWDQNWFAENGVPYQMFAPNLVQPFPIIQQQGPIVMPDVKVSYESLAKARQNLASLQAQTVYERSRLVAVVVKD